jgi:uncharacterized membrane protein YkvA (DUF1232 family)
MKKSFKIKIVFFIAGIIYVISPIDIIPDIVPFVGWLDDVAVFSAAALPLFDLIKKNKKGDI